MNQATRSGLPDTRQINLHNSIETPYWCKLLDVTEAHLATAIETVGNNAQDVKDYLENERAATAGPPENDVTHTA
jgi:uncharacterized protein DUF3606